MNIIEKRIAEVYPHYHLKDNIKILYGNTTPGEDQILRVIVRTLLEIGSFDVFNKIGPLKVSYETFLGRVERYIDYVLLVEAEKYGLANPNNIYSLQLLLIRISQLFQELDGYSRFMKNEGYKGYVKEERISHEGEIREYNNLSTVYIDSLIKGLILLSYIKGYEIYENYQPAFHIPNDDACATTALRFYKHLTANQMKKKETSTPKKPENFIGFNQIRKELNVKKNETFKQYFEELGIKVHGSQNKPTITESDYLKLQEFWKNRNAD